VGDTKVGDTKVGESADSGNLTAATQTPAGTSVGRSCTGRRRSPRWVAALAALAALGLGLSACGGGPPNATGSTNPSGSTNPFHPSEATLLKYSECMRSHGIADFPDPTRTPQGHLGFSIQAGPNSDLDPRSPRYEAADKACRSDLPNGGVLTPAERAASKAKALAYTACMRSHGEPDFPDPDSQGMIQLRNPTGILSPTSPQFVRAAKACQSLDTGFGEQVSVAARAPGGSEGGGS
jgi:hypothetical protein